MKYVLDLKDYVTRLDSDLKDINECFYRYNITDDADNIIATVWFTQMQDSGNIYTVSCRLLSHKLEDFNLYFNIPMNGPYMPANWYFRPPNIGINENNFYGYTTAIEMTRNVAQCVMSIFSNEEHTRWNTK